MQVPLLLAIADKAVMFGSISLANEIVAMSFAKDFHSTDLHCWAYRLKARLAHIQLAHTHDNLAGIAALVVNAINVLGSEYKGAWLIRSHFCTVCVAYDALVCLFPLRSAIFMIHSVFRLTRRRPRGRRH